MKSTLFCFLGMLNFFRCFLKGPQAIWMVEKMYCRRLKDALRAQSASQDWFDHLPMVLLGLRVEPKEDNNLSLPSTFLYEPEPPWAVFQCQLCSAFERLEPPAPFKRSSYVDLSLQQLFEMITCLD